MFLMVCSSNLSRVNYYAQRESRLLRSSLHSSGSSDWQTFYPRNQGLRAYQDRIYQDIPRFNLVFRLSETLFLDAALRHELRKFPPCNHVQAEVDPSGASNQKLGCCQLATETPTALYPDAFYSCTLLAYLALACNERLQALRNYPGGAMDVGRSMSIGGNNRSSFRLWRPVKIMSWPIVSEDSSPIFSTAADQVLLPPSLCVVLSAGFRCCSHCHV